MIRREFVKRSTYGMATLTMTNLFRCTKTSTEKRPNIFFAIADDWGWPHAALYGDRIVKTPAFDKIASNGIIFNNAFTTAPSCTPSRNSILTGQYPWRLKTGANLHSRFPDGVETFPNILEDNGYFVGSYRKAFGPGDDRTRPVAGTKYESPQEFFAKRPKDKPFCFWFGSPDPHRKYEWQSGINSGMKLDQVQVPPCLPDSKEIRTDICDYYWEVQRFDKELAEALKLVEEMGELDNTIVVVTGDNGWPFPRGKSNLYDLGVHIPLAIQWKQKIQSGRVVDDFVSFQDFAPTFLEVAGLRPLPEMTGHSLLPIFVSDKSGIIDGTRDHVLTAKERHTPAQADHWGGTPMRAIRTHDFLYIHNFKPERWPAGDPASSIRGPILSDIDGGPTKTFLVEHKDDPAVKKYYKLCCGKRPADELYDLKKDPNQLKNVAADPAYASILKELNERLMRELMETEDPRALGKGDVFDSYPYSGSIEQR